ncbi:hypothetical protein NQ152_15670 [Microbacterium sp. zg.B48]|uniref:hypothetical protein n=1 Tax=Microbacterium sp. zg.B48 TaxID=2969408 RepID=UPI00214AB732|nr:hypothetical protein [Microbacterium sp. zg.B48]MCR2764946.1 hypothetical protein [Microbacterium sp. zg.B48]
MNEAITRRERADLMAPLIAAVALAVVVVVTTVIRWLETFTPAGLVAGVPFPGVPVDFSPAEGEPVTSVHVTAGDIVARGVNSVSTVSLGLSIVVGALAWLAVIAVFATLAVRFLHGRFFDRGNPRLLDAAAWTMLGGALAVYMLETFGRNGVLAAAGLSGYVPPSWAVAAPFIPIWIAAMALGLISLAFRRGIRMQRDSEGLV